MSLKAGIVGLPNVGKSTLFNAITKKNILAANYPFATIEPNVGVVTVPDTRLEFLEKMYLPSRTIPTTFEFTDIAGLVKGAAKGEALAISFFPISVNAIALLKLFVVLMIPILFMLKERPTLSVISKSLM